MGTKRSNERTTGTGTERAPNDPSGGKPVDRRDFETFPVEHEDKVQPRREPVKRDDLDVSDGGLAPPDFRQDAPPRHQPRPPAPARPPVRQR